MSRHHRIALVTAALLLAAPLYAQNAPQRDARRDSAAQSPAPAAVLVLDSTGVAAPNTMMWPAPTVATRSLRAIDATTERVLFPAPARTSRNTALMIVGGAGMIVGAVVGGRSGTVIMIGGGVVGLIGLWNYLK